MDSGGVIYGLPSSGSANWTNQTFAFGSASNLFIEDNTFTTADDGNTGCGVGGRYVSRYNTYTRSSAPSGFFGWDIHGNQPDANTAGMGAEIYGNLLTYSGGEDCLHLQIFDHRGGMLAAHHNQMTGWFCSGAVESVREEYADNNNISPYTASNGQPQHVSSSYYWQNIKHDEDATIAISTITYPGSGEGLLPSDLGRVIPQENVDFWNYNSAYNGTTQIGVGCGSALPSPAACTTGDGYWVTSQSCANLTNMVGALPTTPITGTLYRCTAANTWTLIYQPYTYPHPLRGETTSTPPTMSGGSWTGRF
jgi:hypothetical protein